ncbi:chromosome segregation protein SMC [Bauldia litoralis]|uniref:Chromosome partition protein Smc n=1 Tax=Bauldia litoralis TaxID=665467 RepID=A0A1G6C7N3_9HYPH|nr:chromosome segregation protein SMC [Bauldia litoralis]SDB28851.1 condensin subunit Smc [Bauldia litoralis]
MKFTRLRVLGFKSFVEPIDLHIEPGLTGVVGPNGCGKSNLVEALRWVMGEASYKNMRASGMDDVIFSGSGNRPPRNTAEVTLVIDNADRTAPATLNDADVLEVSRRIEREAGSVYKINGRDVRARDVQLLFADASSGAHSPAMVGQGKIGELIAAKPKDRRALLEEAAGISGLHNRRHEAELRLSGAEQNLARIDDVVAELDSQLDGLKRQARQAVRYRNLSGEIRKAEATVLHLRWTAATAALKEADEALREATALVNGRSDAQGQAAVAQATAGASLPELRDAAARAGAALQRIIVAREQLDSEEARINERLADLGRRLAQLGDDIAREETLVADNKAILARLDDEEKELEAANAAMTERQATAADRRRTCEESLTASEAALAELTGKVADITARRTQYERSLIEAERRLENQRKELASVTAELDRLGDSQSVEAGLRERSEAVEAAEATVKSAEEQAVAAEGTSAAARDRTARLREPLAEAERTLSRIETEAATLVALLKSSRTEAGTPLIDIVKVDNGFEAALGAAFGDDLDSPADTEAAAYWRLVDRSDADPSLPDGVEALATHVEAPAVLARRLAQIGLVAREDGTRLQSMLKPGQRLVSREGDLWRWDGYIATADSPTAAAQRLATRNRLAELESDAVDAGKLQRERREEMEEANAAMRAAEEAERAARDGWRQAQRAIDQARDQLARAEREAGQQAARRSALEEARNRLTAAVSDLEASRDVAKTALAETPTADSFADQLAVARNKVAEDRAALAEMRAAVESLSREADMRAGRLAAIAVERQSWHERAANAETHIATLTTRRAEAEQEKTKLAEEPEKIEERRRALLSEIASAEEARAAAADTLAEGEAKLAEADKAARVALEQLAEAREQRGRAEERGVAARQRLDETAERIDEALDCMPEEVLAIAELKPGAALPDLGQIEARLDRYRQERERLGGVNLRAEAESQEVGERRDVLVGERDDLVAAIHRLRQGIGSLNREGRERLLAAFGTVNDHFQRLFTHLFGGGEAELQLTESDDPLEAGLEIIARPPGKKPQIMTLLSGGEQALTALSLIFAVFQTNPAPICVLDEVDAPLDDANVERFCNLLEEMTRQTDTRFLVITHNPITMARMSRLFGVTMAERGVSQLVSVDLETAARFQEAV